MEVSIANAPRDELERCRFVRDEDGLGALEAWIRRAQPAVWRYLRLLGCAPHEADDLMQETFVRVLRRYGSLPESDRGRLLRLTARSLFVDACRRRRREVEPWTEAVDVELARTPAALEDTRVDALRACLGQLAPRRREVLELHHVEGLSLASLASSFGLSQNGIKALLQRARTSLRHCVKWRLRCEGTPS